MIKNKVVAIIIAVLVPLMALASVTVTVNGTNHTIPQTNERGWGSAVTAWIQAISSNTLQPIGGTFTLTNDVDFGASYGLKSSYLSTRSSNPSTSGILRLNKTDSIGWRNNANSTNLLLGIDASDNLTFAGDILTTTGAGIFSDDGFYIYDLSDSTKKIDFDPGGTTGTKTTITGAQTANRVITLPDATATLVGADTTQTLTNKTINGSNNTISNVSLSAAVTGTLPIANGGTGQTSASAAFDALAPSQGSNSGKYLTTNGTTTSWGTVDALPSQTGNNGKYLTTDGSASSWSSISLATNVTGTLPIANGGTGQTGANAAFNALAPSQTSNSGKFLTTNGTDSSWATAALTAQGQSEGSGVTTTTIKAPYTQITTTGTDTRLIETGYNNLLLNPSFEGSTATTSWTQGSGTSCAAETTEVSDGAKSLLCTLTAATAASVYQDVTPTVKMSGINFEYGVWIKTASTTLSVCARQAAATVGSCTTVVGDNVWHYYPINYPGPSSGSVGVSVVPLSSTTGTYYIDAGYVGKARNIGTVAQASFFGGMEQAGATGCSYSETTSTGLTDFDALGTGSGCNAWTVSGSVTATGTNDHRPVLSNVAPGQYDITIAGGFTTNSTGICIWQLSDGTNTYQRQTLVGAAGGVTPVLKFSIPYTTAQSSITLQLQASDSHAGGCTLDNTGGSTTNLAWKIYYFPSAAQTVVNMNQVRPPTTQRLTSGTAATYTTPNGVTHISVKVVGGGGGGAGTGSSGPGTGGTGGTSTFAIPSGATLISVTGGAGAAPSSDGGVGGTGTITSPAVEISNTPGGKGGGSSQVSNNSGGMGGSNPMGGAGGGGGGGASAGLSGVANTGGGGGGGGSTSFASGSGGGAGGYTVAQITSPLATYTYTIGAGGTAGAAGTSGFAGGAGGSGYIEVTEYYGNNMPLLVGGVTSNTSGMERVERATIVCSGSSSITSQSGAWLTSVGNVSSGVCSITIPSGIFSASPSCTVAHNASDASVVSMNQLLVNSATSLSYTCRYLNSGSSTVNNCTSASANIICMGAR